VDGSSTLSLSADKSGKVVVKFQQTSPTNAMLNKLAASQDYMETFIPVSVKQVDHYRNDAVITTLGFIEKPADFTRGGKANAVEWTFIFPKLFIELGDPDFAGAPTQIAEALG
jgi:hypothetical protein